MKHLFDAPKGASHDFRGETLTINTFSVAQFSAIQGKAKKAKDAGSLDFLAIIISEGVEEFGPDYKDVILGAPASMMADLAELSTAIMEHNGMTAKTVEADSGNS